MNGFLQLIQCNPAGRLITSPCSEEVHTPPLRGRSAAGSREPRKGGRVYITFQVLLHVARQLYSCVLLLQPVGLWSLFLWVVPLKALVTMRNLKSMACNLEFKDNYLDQCRLPIDLFRLGGLFSFTDHTIFSRELFFHLSRTYSFVPIHATIWKI